MKKLFPLFLVVVLLCCKKKDKTESPAPSGTTTTTTTGGTSTGGSTTGGIAPKYAAEFEAYNSLNSSLNTVYGKVKLYNTSGDLVSVDYIKLDGQNVVQLMSMDYLYTSTKTFTAPVTWEISDLYDKFPDTTFQSRPFPALGFTTAVNTLYNRTKDFTINIDVSTCDSMLFELGGVIKRIPGRSGITSVTFKPSDPVQRSIYDTTEVEVFVKSYNYQIFGLRGRNWKSIAGTGTGSTYKYKN